MSLSTQRNLIHKYVHANVHIVRFEFEAGSVDAMYWLPGSVNHAGPGTATDSPLCQAL